MHFSWFLSPLFGSFHGNFMGNNFLHAIGAIYLCKFSADMGLVFFFVPGAQGVCVCVCVCVCVAQWVASMCVFCGYGSGVSFSFFLDITVPFWKKSDGMKFISQWFLLVAVY